MKLQSIVMPLSEFDHVEKGDALYGLFLEPTPFVFDGLGCTCRYTFDAFR